ncbi:LEAF RUST 10 DISEASE-RESISTANCE LOCUS RECEPTOR-LIKE PROTEIN KINASE-like 1.1 [Camellia lanceoleosa]|uniref:LEAF RUST 10 DISEASE-RESISTANCE LOCUS RECEPTOR-LIKE PROTEIN KINASE-like 1.1 n=1 Tax=Camellia lanceoleosa TaxID=1840588 RepID=A0ACC0I8Y5_9ERIC|nr:LEAF RUST 10 DISEASE-RESISTANCE LOCUS RECEPTOR-LIKE PROTEIN KINASE-like 1.1 [Camellia lanceoleosa]
MVPLITNRNASDLFSLLADGFTIGLLVSNECRECHLNGGQCHCPTFRCIMDEKQGKLQDAREVVVKRLYENNYKRVSQFMNEIEIFTCLRHCNLVSIYGCTSCLSRELLLVYEYIPNGNIADHIHGHRANDIPLVWPIRMNIAIETARALAYLHASDIIHRDVKTDNKLLDNDCCVKVADFELSRLVPNNVTHVSTAP